MTRRLPAAAALAAALVAACGSPSPSSSEEATKSAGQIFADMLAAMGRVQVAHVSGRGLSAGATATLDGVTTRDAARVMISAGGQTAVLVVSGDRAYVTEGGRTVELSADAATQARAFTLARLVACAGMEHGALTKGSTTTIASRPAIAIADDGSAAGGTAGTNYIALDEPHVLLRRVTRGGETPGGSVACGHGSSSGSASPAGDTGTIDWDYPASVPRITPPPTARPGG